MLYLCEVCNICLALRLDLKFHALFWRAFFIPSCPALILYAP